MLDFACIQCIVSSSLLYIAESHQIIVILNNDTIHSFPSLQHAFFFTFFYTSDTSSYDMIILETNWTFHFVSYV